jgi:hypothetical protein
MSKREFETTIAVNKTGGLIFYNRRPNDHVHRAAPTAKGSSLKSALFRRNGY